MSPLQTWTVRSMRLAYSAAGATASAPGAGSERAAIQVERERVDAAGGAVIDHQCEHVRALPARCVERDEPWAGGRERPCADRGRDARRVALGEIEHAVIRRSAGHRGALEWL